MHYNAGCSSDRARFIPARAIALASLVLQRRASDGGLRSTLALNQNDFGKSVTRKIYRKDLRDTVDKNVEMRGNGAEKESKGAQYSSDLFYILEYEFFGNLESAASLKNAKFVFNASLIVINTNKNCRVQIQLKCILFKFPHDGNCNKSLLVILKKQ